MNKKDVSFEKILDDNEVIIETFKPNKKKFYFQGFFIYSLIWFLFIALIVGIKIFDNGPDQMPMAVIYVTLGVFLLVTLLYVPLVITTYNKRIYAYTNKRIVIQGGIIGIDYKSLDHKMIGANEVRVDLLDKLIRQNTGTIKFGSQASPMNQPGMAMFIFNSVEDPYNVYKRIKKYIDQVKSS